MNANTSVGVPIDNPNQSRTKVLLGILITITVSALLCDADLWRPETTYYSNTNPQIAESAAWWNGQLDIVERQWDTALKDGKVYSHFPPLFSIISFVLWPSLGGVPHIFLVIALGLPIPILAYRLFYLVTRKPWVSTILAIAFVCGTSMLPVIKHTFRGAPPYFVNHTLSVIGLLIFTAEFFGKKRVWAASLGFAIMVLSRQLTMAYFLPLIWLAAQSTSPAEKTRRVALAIITLAAVGSTFMTVNYLKFGNPFDSGYMYIYNDRPEDDFSRDAHAHGIFSSYYIPRNLYYLNLGLPNRYDINGEIHLRPNMQGTGIWWTTPLLLWAFFDLRGILRNSTSLALLAGASAVVVALLFYHSTGFVQRGFSRYSLDFLPVLLAIVAPISMTGWRRYVSVAMIAWSVIYFRFLI